MKYFAGILKANRILKLLKQLLDVFNNSQNFKIFLCKYKFN